MPKLYLTGDTHGFIDLRKFEYFQEGSGKDLTKEDYMLVLGDFGIFANNPSDSREVELKEYYDNKPWTTLFIDGNHDNHYRLSKLEPVEMFDNEVGYVTDSIFHLKRGHIYNILGKSFFCMGGAFSIDKLYRTPGVSWWKEEQPTNKEMNFGLDALKNHNNKVDYLLFHTMPSSLFGKYKQYVNILPAHKGQPWYDYTCDYLTEVCNKVKYKRGFSGHWHQDLKIDNWTFMYYNIERLI